MQRSWRRYVSSVQSVQQHRTSRWPTPCQMRCSGQQGHVPRTQTSLSPILSMPEAQEQQQLLQEQEQQQQQQQLVSWRVSLGRT